MPAAVDEVVELLQALIRNACVNDGSPESGQEVRNAATLESYLSGCGLELRTFEPAPGRVSLLGRLAGSDPQAPSLCLMGHTDVVPANPATWRHDPFGGELIDGEVWGRGAVDMLNLTASMAVACRRIAAGGFRPRGDLLYLAVADEEAGGRWGAGWLTEHAWDEVGADYVVTELGGLSLRRRESHRLWVVVAEKGVAWTRLRIRGTPGHGSTPLSADNAVVKAAEVIRRIDAYRPAARLDELWHGLVESLDVAPRLRAALTDPETVWQGCRELEDPLLAKQCHALTHTTFSPNVIRGGAKTNVIPDDVVLDVDIRILPGETPADVATHLAQILGDLSSEVEVEPIASQSATASEIDNPLWGCLERCMQRRFPEATLLPAMVVAGTDARFFRHRGSICFGAGLYSDRLSLGEFFSRFHGDDERIDLDSLSLTTELWLDLVPALLA